MGKQINFFMHNQDIKVFLDFVLKNKDVIMVVNKQRTKEESIVPTLPDDISTSVFFWNKTISPSPKYNYIEKQKYLLVDSMSSEVIEFSRSMGIKHRILDEGRIWIATSYYDCDSVCVKKNASFIRWYDSLARWIKANSVKLPHAKYIMPCAYELFHGDSERSLKTI